MTKFKFKKKFGQNFLNDDYIGDKIVNSINPNESDLIIEIGPGAGAITKKLKKYKTRLIAFEIDQDTKKFLLPLEDEKTTIIYEDFLETDLKKILKSEKYGKLYIIGNLPYYITTPIIEKIIEDQIEPESLTIMVQKEVANRFMAKPHTKDYGYMTVILNYNFNLERITEVDRKKFTPVPNVDSTVVKLIKKEKEPIDYNKFNNILKESFQFKRKTIGNNIKSINKDTLSTILESHGFNLSSRAEELPLEVFIDITKS